MTRIWAVLSSATCVIAGVYLLGSQTAGENSYLETIAHGMGIYFIGKGLYVGPSLWKQADIHDAQPLYPEAEQP